MHTCVFSCGLNEMTLKEMKYLLSTRFIVKTTVY